MSTDPDVISIVELFAELPLMALAAVVDQKYYANPQEELTQVLRLQMRARQWVEERENLDSSHLDAVYNLASELYANESEMQINVDPLQFPFDISEADEGTWAHAWVWVPNEDIEKEIWQQGEQKRQQKLRSQRNDRT
jgi:hypothetical protein